MPYLQSPFSDCYVAWSATRLLFFFFFFLIPFPKVNETESLLVSSSLPVTRAVRARGAGLKNQISVILFKI